MHHPVGDLAIIGQKHQALGVAVETADRIDALGNVDEVHDGPPAALILDGRDEAARFVQKHIARTLLPQHPPVNPDNVAGWVNLCPHLRDRPAVYGDAAGGNHLLGCPPRRDTACGQHPLQTLQRAWPRTSLPIAHAAAWVCADSAG